jgi:hypothetical protein
MISVWYFLVFRFFVHIFAMRLLYKFDIYSQDILSGIVWTFRLLLTIKKKKYGYNKVIISIY